MEPIEDNDYEAGAWITKTCKEAESPQGNLPNITKPSNVTEDAYSPVEDESDSEDDDDEYSDSEDEDTKRAEKERKIKESSETKERIKQEISVTIEKVIKAAREEETVKEKTRQINAKK